MKSKNSIVIRNAIIHVLDSSSGRLSLSDEALELTPDINDFLRHHIEKTICNDALKTITCFADDSTAFQLLTGFSEENMAGTSRELSAMLFDIMCSSEDIPPADLAFVTYQSSGRQYLAILKLNYKETFSHNITGGSTSGTQTSLVKTLASLPAGTKLTEAVIVDLADKGLQILEKKYTVNGEKVNYLSERFLQCNTSLSEKTKFTAMNSIIDSINRKHFCEDVNRQLEPYRVIRRELEDNGQKFAIKDIGQRLYGTSPELMKEFMDKAEKHHIYDETFINTYETADKTLEKRHIITEDGIEIIIPEELLEDTSKIEIQPERDGTSSIHIKYVCRMKIK